MGEIIKFPQYPNPCLSCGNRSLNCFNMCSKYRDYPKMFFNEELSEHRTYSYEHKGYILQQSDYNFHYMILEKTTGKMVMHVQYNKKLSKSAAKQCIEDYIKLREEI